VLVGQPVVLAIAVLQGVGAVLGVAELEVVGKA
jgi:hypothetical protein